MSGLVVSLVVSRVVSRVVRLGHVAGGLVESSAGGLFEAGAGVGN